MNNLPLTHACTVTDAATRHIVDGDRRVRVASMLAPAYSGATLFAILLNRHGEITCNGETFPPPRGYPMKCSCGMMQIECGYYRQVAGHMLAPDGEQWDDDLFAHVPRYWRSSRLLDRAFGGFWLSGMMNRLRNASCAAVPVLRRKDRDFLEAHNQFIIKSLTLNQTKIYVDGTKSYRRIELLSTAGRYDLKAIHLVRDGRAFCYSYLKNKKLSRSDLPEAARLWIKSLRKVDIYHRRFPDVPLLLVRYEDICRDRPRVLSAVCEFLGLGYDPAMASSEPCPMHVIGNRMRHSYDGSVREDRSWEQEMSPGEVAAVTKIMEPYLARFGYLGQ